MTVSFRSAEGPVRWGVIQADTKRDKEKKLENFNQTIFLKIDVLSELSFKKIKKEKYPWITIK